MSTSPLISPRTSRFFAILLFAFASFGCEHSALLEAPPEKLAPYENFAALAKENTAGRDYEIVVLDRSAKSKTLVMAFHGGYIEPGTVELAEAIAGTDLSFYAFIAKAEDSRRFHITSTQYDEPSFLAMLPRANHCLSLHGFRGGETDFCVGGGDAVERKIYIEKLQKEFPEWRTCETCCPPNNGVSPKNVVNRCSASMDGKPPRERPGVQLEMSPPLRDKILADPAFRKKLADFLRTQLARRLSD